MSDESELRILDNIIENLERMTRGDMDEKDRAAMYDKLLKAIALKAKLRGTKRGSGFNQ